MSVGDVPYETIGSVFATRRAGMNQASSSVKSRRLRSVRAA